MAESGNEKVEIVRESPTFFRVFSSHLFDFFLSLILTATLLFPLSLGYMSTPSAKEANATRETIQIESGLYIKNEGHITNIADYYSKLGYTYNEISDSLSPVLNKFFTVYINGELPSSNKIYLDKKIEAKGKAGESLFNNNGARAYTNPDYDQTYSSFYISVAKDFAPGFLGYKANYLAARRTIIILQFAAFETSLLLSYLIFYILFPLFFHRGKQTLGKKLSRIYLLGVDGYSPSIGRFLLSALFHYIFFFLLGPATLMAPYFISLTMMGVRNQRQSLAEYVFALFPVLGKKEEIFETEEELLRNQ